MPRAFSWLLLCILSGLLVLYLLGNDAVQLWDRDEPRYAQTSRQMLASGDWVVPRFLDTVRTAKPVLIYWCQASAMAVFGDNAFAARLPSALAIVLTLLFLGVGLMRETGSNRALWTIFIFGTSGLAIASAKMCITDAVLLLFIMVAQVCVYRLWRVGAEPMSMIGLGVAIGLAGLTKGPVVLGVVGMTVLALCVIGRRSRRYDELASVQVVPPVAPTSNDRPGDRVSRFMPEQFPLIAGIVLGITFLVVYPWLYAISVRAPGFLTTSIGHDVIDRARSGHEGHTGPPGFYLLLVWGTYFPWSLLIPAALVNAWRHRHLPATRFALAAIIGPWVMFELVAGKLPHYILPTYPPLAYLIADLLIRASRGSIKDLQTRLARVGAWIWGVLVTILGLGGFGMLWFANQWDTASTIAASGVFLVSALMGLVVAIQFHRGRVLAAARGMGIGMMVVIAIFYAVLLPRYQPLRLSQRLADHIIANGGRGERGYMIDYKEPSLAFHSGGGLLEQRDDAYLNDTPAEDWPGWIVLTQRVWDSVRDDVKAQWSVVGTETGWAFNADDKSARVLVLKRR